jgi:divalent metal cation (Fe/Co/Zn/Cd) transporter
MRISKKSPKKEKRIMTFSLYANLFFVIVELFMAVYTSSQTVLLDAVYDGIEFFYASSFHFFDPIALSFQQ